MSEILKRNQQIKFEIQILKQNLRLEQFTLNSQAQEIINKIGQLQDECTHSDESGKFEIDGERNCVFCGRHIEW